MEYRLLQLYCRHFKFMTGFRLGHFTYTDRYRNPSGQSIGPLINNLPESQRCFSIEVNKTWPKPVEHGYVFSMAVGTNGE